MKVVEEITCCVVDYGTFISVADKLSETMAKVYYHSPYEIEYQDIRSCVIGRGLDRAERLDEFLDPNVLDTIDLFVFPDISFGGLQRHLRSLGKAVWGHMGGNDLELHRDFFLDVLKKVGLPVIHSETIVGLTALAEYLQENDNKWIKINRFRGNMETWHHRDYRHSLRTLDSLAVIFGGMKEQVIFVVQDEIESETEVGYDGWCIDGQYPSHSFQGYEKKNELYLGSVLADEDLPEEIRIVNEAMAPVLAGYGYRSWWATEIRVADGVPYFIDPTPRMPGQTGEHQLETCSNLADVIWQGANGIVIEPEFAWNFAAEATLHYDMKSKDAAIVDEWKTLHPPEDVLRWMKLYYYCREPDEGGDTYHFSAKNTDEIGVMIGVGNSVDEAIEHLTDNLEMLEGLPVHANIAGFASLLKSIKEAEKHGIKFGGKVPRPETMLKAASL
jgi:hypothetical protein